MNSFVYLFIFLSFRYYVEINKIDFKYIFLNHASYSNPTVVPQVPYSMRIIQKIWRTNYLNALLYVFIAFSLRRITKPSRIILSSDFWNEL